MTAGISTLVALANVAAMLGPVRLPDPPSASATRIVLAPPEIEGQLGSENLQRITTAAIEGMGRDGLQVVTAPSGPACMQADCARALAEAADAAYAITWRIEVDGRDFTTRVQLRDRDRGEIVGESESPCDICGVQEVAAVVADQTAALRNKLDTARAPARISVTTVPSGAQVFVDGVLVGVTPYEDALPPGRHHVEIFKEDFLARQRDVTLVDGVEETIELTLQRRPPDASPERRPMRAAGAVAVALGLAAVVPGATFLALHHRPVRTRCAGDDVDAQGDCRLRYDGVPTGASLVAGGVAAAVAGVVLLIVDSRRHGSGRSARLRAVPGGVQVRF